MRRLTDDQLREMRADLVANPEDVGYGTAKDLIDNLLAARRDLAVYRDRYGPLGGGTTEGECGAARRRFLERLLADAEEGN
jgi:hypothetical protein